MVYWRSVVMLVLVQAVSYSVGMSPSAAFITRAVTAKIGYCTFASVSVIYTALYCILI